MKLIRSLFIPLLLFFISSSFASTPLDDLSQNSVSTVRSAGVEEQAQLFVDISNKLGFINTINGALQPIVSKYDEMQRMKMQVFLREVSVIDYMLEKLPDGEKIISFLKDARELHADSQKMYSALSSVDRQATQFVSETQIYMNNPAAGNFEQFITRTNELEKAYNETLPYVEKVVNKLNSMQNSLDTTIAVLNSGASIQFIGGVYAVLRDMVQSLRDVFVSNRSYIDRYSEAIKKSNEFFDRIQQEFFVAKGETYFIAARQLYENYDFKEASAQLKQFIDAFGNHPKIGEAKDLYRKSSVLSYLPVSIVRALGHDNAFYGIFIAPFILLGAVFAFVLVLKKARKQDRSVKVPVPSAVESQSIVHPATNLSTTARYEDAHKEDTIVAATPVAAYDAIAIQPASNKPFMLKILFASIAIALLVASAAFVAVSKGVFRKGSTAQQATAEYLISAKNAKVRQNPKKSSPVVGELTRGDKCCLLKTEGQWANVKFTKNGVLRVGWLHKSLLNKAGL